jgi:hypothetical protein
MSVPGESPQFFRGAAEGEISRNRSGPRTGADIEPNSGEWRAEGRPAHRRSKAATPAKGGGRISQVEGNLKGQRERRKNRFFVLANP